jgi:hypothetical protein
LVCNKMQRAEGRGVCRSRGAGHPSASSCPASRRKSQTQLQATRKSNIQRANPSHHAHRRSAASRWPTCSTTNITLDECIPMIASSWHGKAWQRKDTEINGVGTGPLAGFSMPAPQQRTPRMHQGSRRDHSLVLVPTQLHTLRSPLLCTAGPSPRHGYQRLHSDRRCRGRKASAPELDDQSVS